MSILGKNFSEIENIKTPCEEKNKGMDMKEMILQYGDNPEVMEILAKQQAQLAKHKKKQEKEKEQTKRMKQKEKKRREPLKYCKSNIKALNKIESIFNFTELFDNDDLKKRLREWYNNGIQPYNAFIGGGRDTDVFKQNARQFVELVKRLKMTDNFGVINSNNAHPKLYVRSKYGLLSGRQAELYVSYVIRIQALKPIKTYFAKIFEECNNQKSYDNRAIEDCYRTLSFFQLFSDTSLKTMISKIARESYNNEFSKNIQKLYGNGMYEDLKIADLPDDVKGEIIKSCYSGLSMKDLVVESIDDMSDMSESESESDSESNSESD